MGYDGVGRGWKKLYASRRGLEKVVYQHEMVGKGDLPAGGGWKRWSVSRRGEKEADRNNKK